MPLILILIEVALALLVLYAIAAIAAAAIGLWIIFIVVAAFMSFFDELDDETKGVIVGIAVAVALGAVSICGIAQFLMSLPSMNIDWVGVMRALFVALAVVLVCFLLYWFGLPLWVQFQRGLERDGVIRALANSKLAKIARYECELEIEKAKRISAALRTLGRERATSDVMQAIGDAFVRERLARIDQIVREYQVYYSQVDRAYRNPNMSDDDRRQVYETCLRQV